LILLSGAWAILTALQLRYLLKTYVEYTSRVQLFLPFTLGTLLCLVGLVYLPSLLWLSIAACDLLAWSYIGTRILLTRRQYEPVGPGVLPKVVWLNPPVEAIQEGDFILTDGEMARRSGNSV